VGLTLGLELDLGICSDNELFLLLGGISFMVLLELGFLSLGNRGFIRFRRFLGGKTLV